MELNRNKYAVFFLSAVLLILLFQKYERRTELKNNYNILLNEKNELEEKLILTNKENYQKKADSEEQLKIINNIALTLNSSTLKNETEFKKIIYLFSEESGLDLREIGKAEYIWKKESYSLKYIFFTFEGDLTGMTKFLYFINKSKVYIDMTKSYIELTRDSFKISLGYLEKNSNLVKEEKK
ncbi:MAG: hypothetical protein LBV03_03120 [Fusobacteriales bacterium]|jgi:hypothetical protein|nr:hypothetical protein [Fusobacteriales bacterium]